MRIALPESAQTIREVYTMIFLRGTGMLLLILGAFSVFSLKLPKGSKAMGGLADAAVATFLVEAILKYICGDFAGIAFLGEVGDASGAMGAVAAAALVGIAMGTEPVYAVASAAAVGGYGILPGFLAAYVLHFVLKYTVKHLPAGLNVILGTLAAAVLGRGIVVLTDPFVNWIISIVGESISVATHQSPLIMGMVLGGLMKMVCTSPLSSMALTAMLGLTGLPMGIAAIACFGGSFTNALVFKRLKLGDTGRVLAVMLEPLTQADIITKHPIPIYGSNFIGGALAGIAAAMLGIVNNAPGTASPIPGMLVPFAFNPPFKVILALVLAAVGGTAAGLAGSAVFRKLGFGNDTVPEEGK